MKLSQITFSDIVKEDILELYGKVIDKEGFIVEKDNPLSTCPYPRWRRNTYY